MAQVIIGSKVPAEASDQLKASDTLYAQNGFAGASSDTPGQRTGTATERARAKASVAEPTTTRCW